LVLAALLAATTVAQEEAYPEHRGYALASEKLSIINEETFELLDTLPLPEGKTVFRWNNATKDRLALIVQDGLLGNLPVTLVVIDLETDKIVNTVRLGYDANRFATSDDGNRGYIFLGGKVFRGTPSLVVVDLEKGTIVAKADRKEPDDFLLIDSGDGLILVEQGLNALKPKYRRSASLELLDAETLESRKKVDLPGPIEQIYLDYPGRIYFLNRGVDHTNDKVRAQGEIYVLNRNTLDAIATVEVGMAPGQMAWDAERQMFYVLTSPWATRKDAAAQLHLIGADGIVASVDLPRRPLAAQPSLDREHFYVLYEDDVVRVDRDLTEAKQFLSLKKSPVQLFEHPENNHFYALHYDSPDVSIVDGASGKTVDKIKSGRTGARIGNVALAAGAQALAVGLVVASGPSHTVNGTSYYNVPIVNPFGLGAEFQKTFASFSEDATVLYVYNANTLDLTMIDTGSNKVIAKVGGGGDDFGTIVDGKILYTVSGSSVRFYDIDNGFEVKGEHSGLEVELLEILGRNKAYIFRGWGKGLGMVDFDNLGELIDIPAVPGRAIQIVDYE
jgi:hypothetical protein